MNVKEYVYVNGENSDSYNDGVYDLITKLSKHILQTHRNIKFTYDNDVKVIKRLRSMAFEILLKKGNQLVLIQDCKKLQEVDPILEIEKYIFALKLELRHCYDAVTLEHLLQNLEEFPSTEIPVSSVLQLLLELKSFNINPEPITNIFYYGKTNPALPEIIYNTKDIPPFQIYPMECFISSDKFEATMETQRFQITRAVPTNIMNELNFLHDSIKSKATIGVESTNISVACDFMSNHVFDRISSYTSLYPNQHFIINSEINLCILENNMIGNKCENVCTSSERGVTTNCLYLPFTQTNAEENESIVDKFFNQSVIDESNSTTSIWNHIWNQFDNINDLCTLDHQTWEYFGEIQSIKELMFITDLPAAAVHLEKIKQINNLPLLSEKVLNSVLLLEEVPTKEFVSDVKSMLLGVESNSFEYRDTIGFTLRKNISVYGVCSESLEKICQEAVGWGNCFKFLWDLVTPKSQSSKLLQEGLIYKAMCANIKELLLYYQAVVLRIFTYENESERLLKIFQKIRSPAALISKVAKVCEPYKENQYVLREGSSILTRIYNETIKVTDTKIALVFYSLLKSCCEVYFRFLQKWIFEGICDDIYGEFMIKIKPQYLRNRSHKFWTKSFSICNDAVPGFLRDLAEPILQCGKTVKLLRICDSKNPVCHVCVTEQPEIKVCLSVTALHDQSLRCREYEKKGKSALGSIFSLSTAILNQKRVKKEINSVIYTERNTAIREEKEREGVLKIAAQMKQKTNLQDQILVHDLQQKKKTEAESSNKNSKEDNIIKEKSQYSERTDIFNYYENLTNNIDKRCMRSQWRVERMKLCEKRMDALNTANRDVENQLQTTKKPNCVITLDSLVETPSSFEDENKNYAEASLRTLVLDTMTKSRTEINQENSTQSHRFLTSHEHKKTNNNNEKRKFHNFAELEILNAKTLSEISPNQNTTNREFNEILKDLSSHCTYRSSAIERPTFLNVMKIDHTANTKIDKMCLQSLGCNMTPNNNELDIQHIEFTPITNETTRRSFQCIENATTLNQGNNDLETPMSCTTDNFTSSSVQSPTSQIHNLENSSPTEISSTEPSNYSHLISKSPLRIKRDSTFSDLFDLAHDERSSNASPVIAPLSITDVEIIDHISLQTYLEKSIRIPLNVQSRLVNNSIIKYLLKENNLLSHLYSLRSYFFLLNGEFTKSLTDSLYARLYEISIPIELFNSATLTNLLERALMNSFNNVYVNSELLSLSATDIPTELHISDPTALDCLSLNYKINWPLNIILDETVMHQYDKVFKFLITSGRVSWVLQEDFNIMKRERKAVTSEQYHKLQLYRHSMTQFMNALHNYLTCSVLHASWAEFEKDLEHSLTVDQIYLSHINYIKRILSRCMLNSRGEKMRACLNNIFKVILKFHNRIRSQNWVMKSTGYVHPNFKKLEQMYKAFCELRTYMAHVAFKLATSGYQPHLIHFLNALNINHLYDLTVKTSRSSTNASEP